LPPESAGLDNDAQSFYMSSRLQPLSAPT